MTVSRSHSWRVQEPGFGSRSIWFQKLGLLAIAWREAKQVTQSPRLEVTCEVQLTDLYHNLTSPWQLCEIFRRDNSPAFCIFVNVRVLSDIILLRDLNPILNHFSDVFSPTPKTDVKSWNKGKDMPLVSKTVIMTTRWYFSRSSI